MIVGDRDQRGVRLGGHLVEEGHDGCARVDVERAGRLVREDQHGLAHECPRDGDALLLTAGESVGDLLDAMPEADPLEHVGGDLTTIPEHASLGMTERHHHVVDRGAPGEQVELLENEADVVAAQTVEPSRPHPAHLASLERDRSGCGCIQHPQDVEQRRLPRPRPSHDRDMVSGSHFERDATKDLQARVIGQQDALGDVVERDETHQLIPLSHCSTPGETS